MLQITSRMDLWVSGMVIDVAMSAGWLIQHFGPD